jgi:hypothetical protein
LGLFWSKSWYPRNIIRAISTDGKIITNECWWNSKLFNSLFFSGYNLFHRVKNCYSLSNKLVEILVSSKHINVVFWILRKSLNQSCHNIIRLITRDSNNRNLTDFKKFPNKGLLQTQILWHTRTLCFVVGIKIFSKISTRRIYNKIKFIWTIFLGNLKKKFGNSKNCINWRSIGKSHSFYRKKHTINKIVTVKYIYLLHRNYGVFLGIYETQFFVPFPNLPV